MVDIFPTFTRDQLLGFLNSNHAAIRTLARSYLDSLPGRIGIRGDIAARLAAFEKSLVGDPKNLHNRVVTEFGSRGATATFVADTLRNTTESIITATKVFGDKDSNAQEQASAVLKCFSSVTMLIGLAGPVGLLAGTGISALLGMITLILDATATDRKKETLVDLLRELKAEDVRSDVEAALTVFTEQIGGLESFQDGSRTFGDILHIAPLYSGTSQFAMAKAGDWLRNPSNQAVETWPDVLLAYAKTVLQLMHLHLTAIQKVRHEDVEHILPIVQGYEERAGASFEKLLDTANDCGDYWHIGTPEFAFDQPRYGYFLRNPRQAKHGWEKMDIDNVGSLSISLRNDRIWAHWMTGDRQLKTGRRGEMFTFTSADAPKGCADVCLVPWTDQNTDLLLVATQGGNLLVNAWHEERNEFHTKSELERSERERNPRLGFTQEFWDAKIPGRVVMARVFRASRGDGAAPQDFVYLVLQDKEDKKDEPATKRWLWRAGLEPLKRRQQQGIEAFTNLDVPVQDKSLRISASKNYLYLYTNVAAWRQRHDDLIGGSRGLWQKLDLPSDKDLPSGEKLGSIYDLYAWSDDDVAACIPGHHEGTWLGDLGHTTYWLWSGHYDTASLKKLQGFDLQVMVAQTVDEIKERARELIVVANVKNVLYFRVFDADWNRVIDTDETKLTHHADFITVIKEKLAILRKEQPTGIEKDKLIAEVAQMVGPAFKWRKFQNAEGIYVRKRKHPSWDYCNNFIKAGPSAKAVHPGPLGAGTFDLRSTTDRGFALDYDRSGKLDHLVFYRPGAGACYILKNEKGASGAERTPGAEFGVVYQRDAPGNGIGGFDLHSAVDRGFAFDYDGSGKLDHLVFYRPGTGGCFIVKKDRGDFTPVYAQGDPGAGIGGFDLKNSADRGFAFDYDGSGKLDHLIFCRPGTATGAGVVVVLKNNRSAGFARVDVNFSSSVGFLAPYFDGLFALDYDGSGKLDHLFRYWCSGGWSGAPAGYAVCRNIRSGVFKGYFEAVAVMPRPGTRNVDGLEEFLWPDDRGFAFDYDSSGKLDHLVFYRPGLGGCLIVKKQPGDPPYTPVYDRRHGGGIGDFDLRSSADRLFAFDYKGSGKLDHLVCYRPGAGMCEILKKNDRGVFERV